MAVASLALLLLTGCGGDPAEPEAPAPSSSSAEPAPEPEETQEAEQVPPGEPAVYERIAASSDCTVLQGEFDTASENFDRVEAGTPQADASLGYMQAADARMQEVGCY